MNRLKELRESKNITQVELAEMLNVTPSYISQAERDEKALSRELLLKLHEQTGVSIDWFLTGKGNMLLESRGNESQSPEKSSTTLIEDLENVSKRVVGALKQIAPQSLEGSFPRVSEELIPIIESYNELSPSMKSKFIEYANMTIRGMLTDPGEEISEKDAAG